MFSKNSKSVFTGAPSTSSLNQTDFLQNSSAKIPRANEEQKETQSIGGALNLTFEPNIKTPAKKICARLFASPTQIEIPIKEIFLLKIKYTNIMKIPAATEPAKEKIKT